MRYVPFFAALVLIPVSHLYAQERQLLTPSVRVRVSTTPPPSRPHWIVGTVIDVTGDHLTIRPERDIGRETQFARNAITRLEVSRGQHSKWLTGLGLGFLAGAAAGAFIGSAALQVEDLATRDAALIGAGFGALGGGLIGSAIGAGIRVDRWHNVPLATLTSAHSPWHDRPLTVSLQIRFQPNRVSAPNW